MIPRLLPLIISLALCGMTSAQVTFIEQGSAMRYLANAVDPGIGTNWTGEVFDDSAWTAGTYGVGFDEDGDARLLLDTTVPIGVRSVYTRAMFNVADTNALTNLYLGVDYDDGYIAWINGVEIYRSSQMPGGDPTWFTVTSSSHESSNYLTADYTPLRDISTLGLAALKDGVNTEETAR